MHNADDDLTFARFVRMTFIAEEFCSVFYFRLTHIKSQMRLITLNVIPLKRDTELYIPGFLKTGLVKISCFLQQKAQNPA